MLRRKKEFKSLNPVDWILLSYIIFTSILIIGFIPQNTHLIYHLLMRIIIITILFLLINLNKTTKRKYLFFIYSFYPIICLIYFYPEINYIDNFFFTDFDPFLAKIELSIFNIQPSISFSEFLPFKWFNELMFASYFSFYFIIIIPGIYLYFKNITVFNKYIFIVLFSFVIFYIIFILFPSEGPQFYFKKEVQEVPVYGFFGKTMRVIQKLGEKPAAAFPSSHVGISVIILFFIRKHIPKYFIYTAIIVALLIVSTVYIRAHYLIDAIAGLIVAPILFFGGNRLYFLIKKS